MDTVKKITSNQKQCLVDFMEENYILLFGKFSGAKGKEIKTAKWNEITTKLNALGPPKRSAEKWKKVCITVCIS